MIHFAIKIAPRTKKNSQRIVKVGNYHKILPSKAYMQYEKDAQWFMPRVEMIDYPVNIKAVYYMPTHRRVDLVNLHEALCDVLVKYRIIEDDNSNIIKSMDGSRVEYDKNNPRTEVWIERVKT